MTDDRDITEDVRERIEDADEGGPDTDSGGSDGPLLTLDLSGESPDSLGSEGGSSTPEDDQEEGQ